MKLLSEEVIAKHSARGHWGRTTLDQLFRQNVRASPDATALRAGHSCTGSCHSGLLELSYRQAEQIVRQLAGGFSKLGFAPGDVIAVQVPNSLEAVLLFLACQRGGYVYSALPLWWRDPDMAPALSRIEPKALVSCVEHDGVFYADFSRSCAFVTASVRYVFSFGGEAPDGATPLDEFFTDMAEGETAEDFLVTADAADAADANDTATLFWEWSDDGFHLAIPRSHNNWIVAGLELVEAAGLERGSIIVSGFAPDSLGALASGLIPWILTGGTLHIEAALERSNPARWREDYVIDFAAVAAARTPELARELPALMEHVRVLGLRHMANQATVDVALPDTRPVWPQLIDLYDFAERAFLPRRRTRPEQPAALNGDPREDGIVADWSDIRLAAVEETGGIQVEVRTKGPAQFEQYYCAQGGLVAKPRFVEADAQGFISTGTLMALSADGVPARLSLKNGAVAGVGTALIPLQPIEKILARHAAIADVAIYPKTDRISGNRLVAAIVASGEARPNLAELSDFLKSQGVAEIKYPVELIFVDQIPRDGMGKIVRPDSVLWCRALATQE